MDNLTIPTSFYAPIFAVIWVLFLWLIKRVVVRRLKKWASKASQHWTDSVISAVSLPANLLILASGLAILINLLTLPREAHKVATVIFQGCIVFSIVFFLDSFVKTLVDQYASKSVFAKISHTVLKGLLRGFVIGIGVLIFLDILGISITPILASLGIGSLAVALALQDTLSNFFAGIYIAIDRPVQVGDFVRLENGSEGVVTEIGWRSARLSTPAQNVVIIPNAKLMGSIITNYSLPSSEMMMTLDLSVHYASDLDRVEKIVHEVAEQVIKKSPAAVGSFKPAVWFHTFGDSGIYFTIVLKIKDFTSQAPIKHELVKALHARFAEEGIQIPYPTRSLEISKTAIQTIKDR